MPRGPGPIGAPPAVQLGTGILAVSNSALASPAAATLFALAPVTPGDKETGNATATAFALTPIAPTAAEKASAAATSFALSPVIAKAADKSSATATAMPLSVVQPTARTRSSAIPATVTMQPIVPSDKDAASSTPSNLVMDVATATFANSQPTANTTPTTFAIFVVATQVAFTFDPRFLTAGQGIAPPKPPPPEPLETTARAPVPYLRLEVPAASSATTASATATIFVLDSAIAEPSWTPTVAALPPQTITTIANTRPARLDLEIATARYSSTSAARTVADVIEMPPQRGRDTSFRDARTGDRAAWRLATRRRCA